ncbi:MAG TPA: hypothetical protein VEQ40_09360 [Pyrinomonadaceae bacterium]|nr:hypothetical protein [Pyrinomonadaceae bacterium]
MKRESDGLMLGRLFFELTIADGIITGKVFLSNNDISPVNGTCRAVGTPEISFMELVFRWGAVDVALTGIAHNVGAINKFRGRFVAFPHGVALKAEYLRLTLTEPDPGDVGTGTGQQT